MTCHGFSSHVSYQTRATTERYRQAIHTKDKSETDKRKTQPRNAIDDRPRQKEKKKKRKAKDAR